MQNDVPKVLVLGAFLFALAFIGKQKKFCISFCANAIFCCRKHNARIAQNMVKLVNVDCLTLSNAFFFFGFAVSVSKISDNFW